MIVPGGGTGSRGSCERGSEGQIERGAGGLGTGGGGRSTLRRMSDKITWMTLERYDKAIALPDEAQWVERWPTYSGLAERLACDGPGGHAHERTGQHDENRPSVDGLM